jgi:signal transduction histidine kinase
MGVPTGGGFDRVLLWVLTDLSWAAALLLRPVRRREAGPSLRAGVGAALILFAYAHVHLTVLPGFFSVDDPAMEQPMVIARGALRVALAVWALGLAATAPSAAWRAFYWRMGGVLALWAVGQAVALQFRSQPGYVPGALSDLGWIIPFFFLAAVAVHEGRAQERVVPARVGEVAPSPSWGAAPWLLVLAAVVGVEGLFGTWHGHPALDAARQALLRVMVVVLALLMAAHEWLTHRARAALARTARESTPTQWVRLVASAIHELGGHLSGIAALDRLLLFPRAAADVRTDAVRIHDRVEAATRVVRNLLTALPPSVAATERVSLDRVVEAALESRRGPLAEEGVALRFTPGRMPETALDSAAVRHVVLWLVDRAAVSIRSMGVAGSIELSTALRHGTQVLTIADTGRTPSGGVMARVKGALLDTAPSDAELEMGRALVAESVARQGGTLTFGPRPGGGAAFEIGLPMNPPAAAFGDRSGRAG